MMALFSAFFLSVWFDSGNIFILLSIISLVLFIVFLGIHIYLKNWKYVLFNLLILGALLFGIYKVLDNISLRKHQPHGEVRNGDIIFLTAKSSQSKAIQTAQILNIQITLKTNK
jgi:hypothetical protein